jgi:hypothetical protein
MRVLCLAVSFVACLSAALVAQAPGQDEAVGPVVANKSTKTFHRPTCQAIKKLVTKNKLEFADAAASKAEGYRACPLCKPDGADPKVGTKPKAGKGNKKGEGTSLAADDGTLKFSRDIAPIFLGNCMGCHNAEKKKKGFDLSTFQKLMAGGEDGKVILPGNPDESQLVLRIKGEGGLRKMPPGAQRNLAPETVARIEQWVKDGARLDAGIDPASLLAKIAPSTEDIRKGELAKLSPEQRDKKLEETGLERWKKASPKTTPEITSGKTFVIFSNSPKARAQTLAKGLETQRTLLLNILGPGAAASLAGPEKVSIYVFNEPPHYVEFARTIEMREVEASEEAHGNLAVESPYIAAVDPLHGREETPAKKSRLKKDDDGASSPARSLPGIVTEQLAVAASNAAGKPPRWLSLGLGAYVASQVEPRSPYYRQVREDAHRVYEAGWATKAQESLGGEGDADRVRGVGFSLLEWINTSAKPYFIPFIREMLQGQEKLDNAIKAMTGGDRAQFLEAWGQWVALRYGRRR